MRMVYTESRLPVKIGDAVKTSDGEYYFVSNLYKPKSPASTGRVGLVAEIEDKSLRSEFTYYPSVINTEWVEREDRGELRVNNGWTLVRLTEDHIRNIAFRVMENDPVSWRIGDWLLVADDSGETFCCALHEKKTEEEALRHMLFTQEDMARNIYNDTPAILFPNE